jgi:hypothetical protein
VVGWACTTPLVMPMTSTQKAVLENPFGGIFLLLRSKGCAAGLTARPAALRLRAPNQRETLGNSRATRHIFAGILDYVNEYRVKLVKN